MPLKNCKVHLELNCIEDCILSSAGDLAKFEITDAKLHVPIVTLSSKDSGNQTKQLRKGFKRSVYWNNYKKKGGSAGGSNDVAGKKTIKSVPRGEIKNYIVLIDRRNFYDQPINDLKKKYDEVKKVSTGHGDDYSTESLLDYAYFRDNYKLIPVDLSKQKALDADPRAIHQIAFQGVLGGNDNTKIRLYTILEQSKETVLEFYKETAKLL